jgi:hypothetical protein
MEAKMAVIQIAVRTFYTCDEARIIPTTVMTIDSAELAKVPWAEALAQILEGLRKSVEGSPLTDLREMTAAEVEAHMAEAKTSEAKPSPFGAH